MLRVWLNPGPALIDHLWQSTVVAALALLVLAAFRPLLTARARRAIAWLALLKFVLPGAAFFPHLPAPALPLLASFARRTASTAGVVSSSPHFPILYFVWAAGALAVIVAFLWRQSLPDNPAPTDNPIKPALTEASAASGLPAPPSVRVVPSSQSPAIAGLGKPVLLFPSGLEDSLTLPELRAVLLHECEHARRRDNLWAALRVPFLAAFWFHPLVWVLSRRISLETEMVCDEAVLSHGVDAHTYVSALAKTIRHAIGFLPADAAAAGATPLGLRLSNILTYRPSAPWRRWAIAAPLLVALAAMIALSSYAGSITRPAGPSAIWAPSLGNGTLTSASHAEGKPLLLRLVSPPEDSSVPFPVDRPAPSYPATLRRAGISGQATVGFTVTADGAVRDPYVAEYDDPAFAAAAVAAILDWRYRPAQSNGQPIESTVKVRILFTADPWPAALPPAERPIHISVQDD